MGSPERSLHAVTSTVHSLLASRSTQVAESWQQAHEKSLHELFRSLDKNGDGQISPEEFTGASASSWAAMHTIAMSLPTVEDTFHKIGHTLLQQPKIGDPWYSWVATWIYYLFLIQIALAIMEHVRYWLGLRCLPAKKRWPTLEDKRRLPDGKPVHVSNAEAACWYDTPQTGVYITLKTAFMVLSGLALLRIVQGCIVFVSAVASINVANIVPLRAWRAFWLGATRWQVYLLLASLGYYKVPVTGKFASSEEVKLLMGNHVCLIEVIVMFAEAFPSFVSRVENLSIPLFTGIVHAVDAILVDRKASSSRGGALDEIRRRVLNPKAPQVMIYPEGTCGNSNTLFRFNKGPFSLGKPVQLACFKYPYHSYNPAYIGRCLGGNELGDVILHCTLQFVNRIEVRILPVHYPTKEEIESEPKGALYAKNMQQRMALELGNNTSDATSKDYDEALRRFNEARREEKMKRQLKQKGRLSGLRSKPDKRSRATTSDIVETAEAAGGESLGSENSVPSDYELGDNVAGDPDGTKPAECVEGKVWWPWTAWDSVLTRVKNMIAEESKGKRTSGKKDDDKRE